LSGFDDVSSRPAEGVYVVKSPESGVSLLSLGDFECHFDACKDRVRPTLREIGLSRALASSGSSSSKSVAAAAPLTKHFAESSRA